MAVNVRLKTEGEEKPQRVDTSAIFIAGFSFIRRLAVYVKEDTQIRLKDLPAMQVHIHDPLQVSINALIGKGRIIVAVTDDIRALFQILTDTVDGIDVMKNPVRQEQCRQFISIPLNKAAQCVPQ